VVGGGIVGLAVARRLLAERPGATVVVYEKETAVGTHQTGHNSGVVHAGVYYPPGSLKADLCRRGVGLLREFCADHGIEVQDLGKVIVARDDSERAGLERIWERARANGVPGLARLDAAGLARVEPHTTGVAAVHSPKTAIVDFAAVAAALASEVAAAGGEVRLGRPVEALRRDGLAWRVVAGATGGERYDSVVVCAGLGTDSLTGAGRRAALRIMPFRGQYHRLAPGVTHLVRGLVYPVPDPRYPFLGIHLTRHVGGEVLVGPNAVLAFALEGYRWSDVDPAAMAALALWPGSWRLARRHWRTGVREMTTALSRHAFAAAARTYVPAISDADLLPAGAGVRAQAVDRDGGLVDDFVVDADSGMVVVRNAPSPAATSSLAIAEHLVGLVP